MLHSLFLRRISLRRVLPATILTVIPFVLWPQAVQAQVTAAPAGTTIGNQASATYTDGSNVQRTATSNLVTTIVQQVAAVDLTADNSHLAGIGSPVYFPHTLVNNSNGTDTFTLTASDASGDNFNVSPVIYADANGDGVPDNTTPITTTGPLAAGATLNFIVAGSVPSSGISAGQSADVTVTARSIFDSSVADTNTDTVAVTNNAAVSVVKAIDDSNGASPSGPYTYTLTYTNNGNTTATNLTVTDNIPSGMTYEAGSGRWSASGATVLGDGAAGDPVGINYAFASAGNGTVTAVIASVAPGTSGRVTFQVNVNSSVTPGTISNTASFTYNDGTQSRSGNTNTVPFFVIQTSSVTFTGQTVASASQGGTVTFANTLTNTGSGTDTFDVVVNSPGSFPAGTSFQLFQSDGATPLLDSNGNGTPDTGPVARAGSYQVVLRAVLPPGVSGGGAYIVTKTATSQFDTTKSATATDTLTTIAANSVDLTNTPNPGGDGAGAGPEASPVTTASGNPGATVRIELDVQNTSATPDSFILQASNTAVFSPAVSLPAGFTVTFRDASNTVVTNTSIIAPGSTRTLYADVFIPAGTAPQDVEVYFRAVSPTTGAQDIIHDRVTVNTVSSLSVEPDNVGQVFASNAVVYAHTITNTGNVALSNVTLSRTDTATGFSSVIYRDTNNNGVLDAAEAATPLTSLASLAAGETVALFVKVFAPSGASPGSANVTTLTGSVSGGPSDSAADTTTVITGDLRVTKEQAIDPDGDGGAAVGAYTTTAQSTRPGAIIRYRITVTNTGAGPVSGVVVNDTTPGFTVYDNGDGTSSSTGGAVWTTNGTTFTAASTVPADGSAGPLVFSVGTLTPGQSATITFGVKIRQ